jgi:hypothetical protein
MDADRFDCMTLAFVSGRSRRSLLASLVGAIAALFGLSGLDTDLEEGLGVEARGKRRKKGKGKDKKKKRRKKKNQKKDERECSTNSDCPPPQTCNAGSGECVCPHNCCSDRDCPPGFSCLNVNNSFNCFAAG